MESTAYPVVQENGQRRYGPPADADYPPKGSEVFVGKLPRDLFEEELLPVFEKIGKIYEARIMMDYNGSNRGYAFVMFYKPEDAKRAIKELDNHEIRKGKFIGVCKSVDNCRLFVGGIPKTKTREEILQEMKKVTEGVVDVILYSSVSDKNKNRGFAFVEYDTHRAAAMARRKLLPGKIQLWGHEIAVDWAEPEPEVDEDVMQKVMVLYVRNLMMSTTEDQIRDTFSLNGELKLSKVKKLRDFAFVHFNSREDAEKALDAKKDCILDGSVIEVTWAKPVDRATRFRANKSKIGNIITCPQVVCPPPVYEMYPFSPAFAQPVQQNNIPRGVPRIRGRGRGAAGMRGVRGMPPSLPRHPVFHRPIEHRLVDLKPGMEITPTIIKATRLPTQVLYDLCQKQNWGEPQYHLHSSPMNGEEGGECRHLFLYKVNIPGLSSQYNVFTPNKLSVSQDEAKQHAAEHVLGQLGIRVDNTEIPILNSAVALPPCIFPATNAPFARYGPVSFIPPQPFDHGCFDGMIGPSGQAIIM